jgi:hypothetical protein
MTTGILRFGMAQLLERAVQGNLPIESDARLRRHSDSSSLIILKYFENQTPQSIGLRGCADLHGSILNINKPISLREEVVLMRFSEVPVGLLLSLSFRERLAPSALPVSLPIQLFL